jgi:hypothetical protein
MQERGVDLDCFRELSKVAIVTKTAPARTIIATVPATASSSVVVEEEAVTVSVCTWVITVVSVVVEDMVAVANCT